MFAYYNNAKKTQFKTIKPAFIIFCLSSFTFCILTIFLDKKTNVFLNLAFIFSAILISVIFLAFCIETKPKIMQISLPQQDVFCNKQYLTLLLDKCLKTIKNKSDKKFINDFYVMLNTDFEHTVNLKINEYAEHLLYITSKYGIR